MLLVSYVQETGTIVGHGMYLLQNFMECFEVRPGLMTIHDAQTDVRRNGRALGLGA